MLRFSGEWRIVSTWIILLHLATFPSYQPQKHWSRPDLECCRSLTFPDRSGLFENRRGVKTGGPPALKRAVISPVKSQRQSWLRGYSSVGRASRSQRFFAVL